MYLESLWNPSSSLTEKLLDLSFSVWIANPEGQNKAEWFSRVTPKGACESKSFCSAKLCLTYSGKETLVLTSKSSEALTYEKHIDIL